MTVENMNDVNSEEIGTSAKNLQPKLDEAATASSSATSNGITNGHIHTNGHYHGGPSFKYPAEAAELEDRFIDEPRKLRVAVIGAGLSGVLAGVLLPAKVPNIELTIYEKNEDVGGTWLENVYPGVRCDIPSHVYQSTFEPNTQWSEQFAQGSEILEYWQGVARKYNVYQHVKFGQRIEEADWDQQASKWTLKVHDLKSEATNIEHADVLFTAIGRFNTWKLPSYPGMSDYKGTLTHSSNYDPTFDTTGKRVAVIGNGASGIQLVSNVQRTATHLDHYARNKTWIAASWAGDERTFEPQPYPEEQKESFKDPEKYLAFRKEMEAKYWRRFQGFFKGSKQNQESRDRFIEIMKERLTKKPELLEHLVPDFSPNCRRLTPGPGYLEAIAEDNVDYIQRPIARFTETGIETVDGKQRDVDAIFCATGSKSDMAPPFPVRAFGLDLQSVWGQDGLYGFPYTYLGLSTPGFPNLFFIQGPHGTGAAGTVPHNAETQLTYYAKLLRKMSREGIKTMVPSQKAADDFVEYSDRFFPTTVVSELCSSWYNGGRPGGRVHGVWPGSACHATVVRKEPRWEDYDYEYLSSDGNRFSWYFGNGWTKKEADPNTDMTSYLKPQGEVDLKTVHEDWWSFP